MGKQKYTQTTSTATSTGTTRKGRESYSSTKLWARRNKRRDEADVRQAKYDVLTLDEKIASAKLGGGKRELARLVALKAAGTK